MSLQTNSDDDDGIVHEDKTEKITLKLVEESHGYYALSISARNGKGSFSGRTRYIQNREQLVFECRQAGVPDEFTFDFLKESPLGGDGDDE